MAGDDPAVQAGASSGLQASQAGAAAILQKQTGEPPMSERSWTEKVVGSYYRPPTGICQFPYSYASTPRNLNSGQIFGAYWETDSEQRQRCKTINSVEILCSNVGAAVTLCKIGIWDYATNAKLAETADFSGNLIANQVTRPLVTPLPMPTKPFMVGMLAVFTTTAPQIAVLNTPGSTGSAITTPVLGFTHAGLADLPNPLVPVPSSIVPWFGLF